MKVIKSRRAFLRDLGLSAAALPFMMNLSTFERFAVPVRKRRLVIVFSPDGIVPSTFWPDATGSSFELKPTLKPLEPFKQRMLVLRGVSDKVRGDGDNHMRGIGCLLTGAELFPGNVQGGSDSPAGWSSGISIDQEIKNFLQASPKTRTRFGSLELGVMVPEHADTWTRMSYAGPNKPLTPIDDPYQLFNKLYGEQKDREIVNSILDDLKQDLDRIRNYVSAQDRRLLEEHETLVRSMEVEIASSRKLPSVHAEPPLQPGIRKENDRIPELSKLQIDLLVSSFISDSARVATLQYTNSVGQARMTWLGIKEGQHDLSHEPDSNAAAQEKLTRINAWYCSQIAYLAQRLAETKEPDGTGNMLDNTMIVWTNELGQGNTHTLDNIPFVMVGNGLDFKMGRSLDMGHAPHNRLLLSLSSGFGHRIARFGNPDYCGAGEFSTLT